MCNLVEEGSLIFIVALIDEVRRIGAFSSMIKSKCGIICDIVEKNGFYCAPARFRVDVPMILCMGCAPARFRVDVPIIL